MTADSPNDARRTNIRVSAFQLAAIRGTFRLLERVAPVPGTALAERIWCTVPPLRGSVAHDHRPGPGRRLAVSVAGGELASEAWGEGPPVYLTAGWGGWRGQLGAFVEPLVAAGYQVVAFDALSHGKSAPGAMGPRRSTLGEFADSLRAVAEVAGRPHGIVAHSAGCIAAGLAVADGLPVDRMVFLAPMVAAVPYISDFRHILGFGPRIEAGLVARLERRVGRSLDDFDLRHLARRIPAPLLVIHDRDDKETRFTDGEEVAAAWPDAALLATDGLGHRRILRDPGVHATATGFLTGTRP